jgi:hypothetical protein
LRCINLIAGAQTGRALASAAELPHPAGLLPLLPGVAVKKLALCTALLLISSSAFAVKDCEALKSEIAAKLDDKKVAHYTLSIIAKDAAADGQVVGSCAGGKQRIVYKKAAPAAKP